MELIDQTAYLNHYYLIADLTAGLMIFLPVTGFGHSTRGETDLRLETAPAWTLNLLRFQVGVVYVFAGLAKWNADWLLHAEPLRIWLAARTDLPWIGPWLGQVWVAYAASWFGALFDTFIICLLLWRPTRKPAYALVIVFHLATLLLFNIGMFPWIMVAAATVFFRRTGRGLSWRVWSPAARRRFRRARRRGGSRHSCARCWAPTRWCNWRCRCVPILPPPPRVDMRRLQLRLARDDRGEDGLRGVLCLQPAHGRAPTAVRLKSI